ncbi:hypothetical protein SLEP1_g17030 [Rubroshorea leprosula]|uniref:Cullin family profile domain-containing protein n=1 Tax=Rubroshorea leprosula TaxID=152421 RepID=A0AAV5ISW0_9ROSI|nr:hypothetical protein SLEP1_g17030 [Rubroshorea leprosula]
MCTQKPPHDYSQQLYDKYREDFEEYINSTVLPSLREKHDEFMLRELVKRWANHKVMVRWLSRFFHYLDRYFIARRSLPALNEVGLTCFRNQVYNDVKDEVRDAVIKLIDKEREGEQVDRALLKNVLDIFVDIGMGKMEQYEKDFESSFLKDTGGYYSRKASIWILEDSCPDYMLKCEECLKKERERVSHYLHLSSEPKLVEKVQQELLVVFAGQLLEKEHSGCKALLRDDKVDDLSRMKKLARRLLFDRSANDEHERSILTKLKQQCGGQFTSKMEGMVTDLTLARENQTSFEDYLSTNPAAHPGIDLTVTVLTTGFWPSYKSFDLNLPAEMVKCVEVFKGFYETKTKHRKLTWIYSLGTCHINGKFEQKTIELIVSTYQAAVLLLFNSSNRLSYSEIMAQLNLTHEDLVRLLHSLSCAKYKILTKEPNTRTISQTDSFEFNFKFTDRMRRIKIPLLPVDERKKVVEDVDKDRRYAIDAAIVRIMKSRKVLGHQQLVSECVEQLSRMFKPNTRTISQTDSFEFNSKFTDRMRRIKIPLPPVDERKKVVEDVDKDRRYAIDAAIVRIMKSRKVLAHQQLVSECVEQLSRMFKVIFAINFLLLITSDGTCSLILKQLRSGWKISSLETI